MTDRMRVSMVVERDGKPFAVFTGEVLDVNFSADLVEAGAVDGYRVYERDGRRQVTISYSESEASYQWVDGR